jgi:hypothetical protein
VEDLLAKEDLYHLFASLRFLEERSWLNEEFFSSYTSLTPNDFEKRPLRMEVLPKERFGSVGAEFMRKKFHNVSHLKEMGLIFVLPVVQEKGVFLRMFSLLLHYVHEVSFYSQYFAQCSKEPESFTRNLLAALRGDIRESAPPIENLFSWLIVQRYLAKEEPQDPRLAIPHVSPEAMFWRQAVEDFGRLGENDPSLGLSFWAGKSHVGGFFPPEKGGEIVSFNFEDNAFSAARGGGTHGESQYTYHMHEALWNRLFTAYFGEAPHFKKGEEVLEELMIEDFSQGFLGFKIRSSA